MVKIHPPFCNPFKTAVTFWGKTLEIVKTHVSIHCTINTIAGNQWQSRPIIYNYIYCPRPHFPFWVQITCNQKSQIRSPTKAQPTRGQSFVANQDPSHTLKPLYSSIFTNHIRSSLLNGSGDRFCCWTRSVPLPLTMSNLPRLLTHVARSGELEPSTFSPISTARLWSGSASSSLPAARTNLGRRRRRRRFQQRQM